MSDYKLVVPILCSECMSITAFDIDQGSLRGATYECGCGLTMIINQDLSTKTIDDHRVDEAFRESNVSMPDDARSGFVELT